jgi:hypothetical protein
MRFSFLLPAVAVALLWHLRHQKFKEAEFSNYFSFSNLLAAKIYSNLLYMRGV